MKKHLPARRACALPAATCLALLVAACAGPAPAITAETRRPDGECAAPAVDAAGDAVAGDVHWVLESDRGNRWELDEWCRGVGAPVIAAPAAAAVRVDSVAVITWNVHVGAARLDDFVAALRSGALTGEPVPHFVLLLQEVRRGGRAVPAVLPQDGRGTRRQGVGRVDADSDIVATARRLDLGLFYAPSMRNGGRDDAEDRGNAILSSLPLLEHTAIELPLLAQRRVAVAATVPVLDAAGRPRSLRVASVHLDYGASMRAPLAPLGSGRTLQAAALAGALASDGNTVVGGDFNTWSLQRLEGGLALMQRRFPDLPDGDGAATFHTAGVWPRRLDHLFLRARDAAGSAPARIDDRWGSDHHPVLAWIRFPADGRHAAH